MAIPIYQMTFGRINDDNEHGLIFTSEDDSSNQSFIFTIPIINDNIINHNETIYFPVLKNNEPTYLEYNFDNQNRHKLMFSIDEMNLQIEFRIDYIISPPSIINQNQDWFEQQPTYIGNANPLNDVYLNDNNQKFLMLWPTDILELDRICVPDENGNSCIFVGRTPKFSVRP